MNLQKLLTKFGLMLTALLFFASATFAADIYVSSTGGDDLVGTGTNASPYATILKAVTVAAAGDVIYVADGTYGEALVAVTKDVTIVAYSRNGGTDVNFASGFNINSDAVSLGATGNKFIIGALTLTKGVTTIATANVEITTGGTLTRKDGTISAVPTYANVINITYTSTVNTVASVELPADLKGGTLNVNVTAAKLVTVNSVLAAGAITVAANNTLEFAANATVTGAVTNNGNIKLNTTKFTVDANGAVLAFANAGKIYSTTASTIGNGYLEVTNGKTAAGTINYSGDGEVPNLTIASTFNGVLNVNSHISIYGTLNVASSTAGALTVAATKIVNLKGNFSRTDPTVGNVASATGAFKFNGTIDQSLDPGANLTINDLAVDNAGKTITLVKSVTLLGNLTITNGKLDAGDNNLFLTGVGKTFTNSGEFFSSTGVGYIIISAATTLEGSGIFSNVDIRNAATVTVGAAALSAKFAQNLILRSGTLALNDVNDAVVFYSTSYATTPKITRYIGAGIVTLAGAPADLACAPGVTYDLVYITNGSLAAGAEWIGSSINNLSITKGAAVGTVTAPAENSTISGAVSLMDAGNGLSISNDFSLATAGKTHTVEGTFSGAGTIKVIADAVVINGKNVTTDTAGGSELVDVQVANSGSQTFTMTNIQKITGDFTYSGGTASVTFNPNVTVATDITGNLTLTDGTLSITGGKDAVVVGGTGTLTLGTLNVNNSLTITGAVGQNGANVVIADSKKLTLGAAYTHTGGTITGAGWLVAGNGANVAYTLTAPLSVPNFELKAGALANTITVTAQDLTVSNKLLLTKGTLDFNALNVTVSGNDVTIAAVADVAFANTGGGDAVGALNLTGSNPVLTMDGSEALDNLTLNSAGTLTLADDKEGLSTQTNNTLTVNRTLTQTAGNIALAQHSITIATANGKLARTAGSWTASTTVGKEGWLNWTSTTAGNFGQGAGFSIPNLNVAADLTAAQTGAANKWSVTNYLTLAADLNVTTANNLELADGIKIERKALIAAAAFDTAPKFLGKVNVIYSGANAYVPGLEWPADATTSILNSVKVVSTALSVTPAAGKEPEVISLLDVAAPIVQTGVQLKMANGAWLKTTAAANVPQVLGQVTGGTMNVEFANTVALTTDVNFFDANGAAPDHKIGDVKLTGTADVILHVGAPLTYTGTITFAGAASDLDVATQAIKVQGDVTQTAATSGWFLEDAVAVAPATGNVDLTFSGGNDQIVTLKADLVVEQGMNPYNAAPYPVTNNRHFNVIIDKTAGKKVTLAGSSLDFATEQSSINLKSGIVETDGTASVVLFQSKTTGNVPTQGFTRTSGVIAGNVKKNIQTTKTIENSVVVFPLGDASGNYKPATFYFKTDVPNTFDLTLDYQPEIPGGQNGFPLMSGTKQITNYSPFFWYAKVSQSLAPSYKYDVELGSQGYLDYEKDGIQNVRLVRRDSGNVANPWVLQGADGNYDNSTIAVDFPVVKVIDATGGLTTQGSKFSYSQMNKAPVFASVGAQTVPELDSLKFTITASDADLGQTPTLAVVSKPAGSTVTITNASAAFVWHTTVADSGTHKLILSATDGALTTYDTTSIKVTNVNQAPVFTVAGSLADTVAVAEGIAFTHTYVATDEADNVNLYYTILAGPTGATLDKTTGAFSWTPAYETNGTFETLTVVVFDTDSSKSDTTTSVLRITKTNRAPVLARVSTSLVGAEGSLFSFEFAGTDPDAGDVLSYSVVEKDAKDTTAVMVGSKLNWTPSYTAAGTYNFIVTVTDNGAPNLSDKDTIQVVILNANGTPTFTTVLENQTIKFGESISVTYAATDPDGDALTFAFNGESPEGSTLNATTGEFTWTPTANQTAIYLIKVRVGDGHGGVAETQAEITVTFVTAVDELGIPTEYALEQNYPNPFNPTTVIRFGLPEQSNVTLKVYNLLGQEVATLLNTVKAAGWHEVNFNASSLSTGLYIYRIEATNFVSIKKMMLVK